jgi:hypothetical protein
MSIGIRDLIVVEESLKKKEGEKKMNSKMGVIN